MRKAEDTVELFCPRCGLIGDRVRPASIPAVIQQVVTPCPDCDEGRLMGELWVLDSPTMLERAITCPHDAGDARRPCQEPVPADTDLPELLARRSDLGAV